MIRTLSAIAVFNRCRSKGIMMRLTACAALLLLTLPATSHETEARRILDLSGVRGGFVVHLGSGDGELTAALRAGESFQVHGLDRDPKRVDRARDAVRSKG